MKPWKLQRTAQCRKCPWIRGSNPHAIPNGYSEKKHRALVSTIAKQGDLASAFGAVQHVMACHETGDAHCVGWLVNQMGPGNNIGLRIQMMSCENAAALRLRGKQHATFEETLP